MGRFTSGFRGMSQGEKYEAYYNGARNNLLLAIIFTVVNCVLAAVGANVYFLFSCSFPYAMAYDGAFFTGLACTEEEFLALGFTQSDMMPMWYLYVMLIPAVIAIALYVLCWVFSKKRVGWLIAATVLFVLDSLFMILYYVPDITMILDYLFHAWVLFLLIRGIIAHFKLKSLNAQQAFVQTDVFGTTQAVNSVDPAGMQDIYAGLDTEEKKQPEPAADDTPVLHRADYSVKNRILLIIQWEEYEICYRRVGKVNELVVNSMVYDILETGAMETAHELACKVGGHEITAGTGADSFMYITFDGQTIKRKLRLV